MIFKNDKTRKIFRLSVAVIFIVSGIFSLPKGLFLIGAGCLYGYKGIFG
ncbi:hypothetical protein [Clostridium cellulovorans]|uniref:Uncharacterized protein n=1 Tax=Clostridium cellulovorans (strain ATCC 35296 / DSM 3052 / OCM 3 / 743B) TaxID=573061 RepID=D9SU47_CLOC7|nr:hypothetical protein [Clostridium cellulovorans]ADL50885.1 hypothetical protein Clocel_1128 [Clostridium cellulovorans 743B]